MQFLYPGYLFGLFMIAIPIIIHFFNFQKAKKVYFTNVAFLKTIKEETNARNKIKHLLVLLSRILFIIFLVITFAQPYLPREQAQAVNEGNSVSIYLDNSYSLENERNNKKLLDIGVDYVGEIAKLFQVQSTFQLLDNTFEGQPGFFYAKDKLLEQLTEFTYANISRKLEEVKQKQLNNMAKGGAATRQHIFYLSDFQQSTVGDLSQLLWDSLNYFYMIPLTADSESNLYIDSVWLEKPFIRPLENNLCHVRIINTGEKDLEEKIVKLYIDNKQVSSSTLDFKANGSKDISLHFSIKSSGIKNCKVSIEEYPISFDNDFYFTLNTAPEVRIVVLSYDQNPYLASVYSNEDFFSMRTFTPLTIDYHALQNADLIILDGLNRIDNALLIALEEALQKGTHLAVFPGANVDSNAYSRLVNTPLNIVNTQAVSQRYAVALPAKKEPFFQGVFAQVNASMSMPQVQPLLTWASAEKTLLRLKNNYPFLSLWSRKKGKVLLFCSSLNTQFSNFARHALFVPVMYKMAIYAKAPSEKLYYSFSDRTAQIKLDGIEKSRLFKLSTQDVEIIPAQRVVGQSLLINIPASGLQAGNYAVKQVYTDSTYSYISFNYASYESQIHYYSAEELKGFFANYPNVQIFENTDSREFVQKFQDINKAVPLWRYALILALLCLVAEVLLIRFSN